jgi:glycosyltransferase involved in cell wall biosynthesis
MRVGIDICRLTDPLTGVGNYIRNLLEGLALIDDQNQYVLYPYFDTCFPKRFKELAEFMPEQGNFSLHGLDKNELLVKLMWVKLKLPKEAQLAPVDVTHSTNIAAPRMRSSKLTVTVHDCSFLRQPGWHKAGNIEFSSKALKNAVRRADLLIAPSKFTAQELEEFYPQTEGRVRVAAEAVHDSFSPAGPDEDLDVIRKKYGLNRPYLLFVGTLEPRKNLIRLIHAFHTLLDQGRRDFDLVLAGGEGWKAGSIINTIHDPAGYGHVRWLGYVPGEDLAPLYRAAYAAVYPSLYEGFGLPVLEAMSCGAPVITSRAASLPEVGGPAVLYVEPEETESMLSQMMRIMDDIELRDEMVTNGLKQAAAFSKERMGKETLAVYEELGG